MITLTVALLASSALLARADVSPNEPGPGEVFNQGTTCKTAWTGDTASPSLWGNMSIELMTGSNTGMVHLTTVTSGQDGTKDGEFTYPCPAVTVNSAIYFYQYSAPGSPLTWTTRFAIASESGQTTPPQNPTEPDGKAVPWGTGALTDPSTAVPAPAYLAAGAGAGASTPATGNSTTAGSTTAGSTTNATTPSTPVTPSTTPSANPSNPPSKSASPTNTSTSPQNSTLGGAAVGLRGEVLSTRAIITLFGACLAFMLF